MQSHTWLFLSTVLLRDSLWELLPRVWWWWWWWWWWCSRWITSELILNQGVIKSKRKFSDNFRSGFNNCFDQGLILHSAVSQSVPVTASLWRTASVGQWPPPTSHTQPFTPSEPEPESHVQYKCTVQSMYNIFSERAYNIKILYIYIAASFCFHLYLPQLQPYSTKQCINTSSVNI